MSAPATPFLSTYSRRIYKRRSGNNRPTATTKKQKAEDKLRSETNDDLMKKTWFTYRCSPLHQFKSDAASLKLYSRLLSATFAANKQKKMGVGLDEEDPPAKGIFSLAKGLATKSGEADAVKLSVYTREKKLAAEMYLCSVDAQPLLENMINSADERFIGTERTLAQHFTVLPLLLSRGNVSSRNIFFDWLKTEFDCTIGKLEFSSLSLSWMLGMWSTIQADEAKPKPVKITWSFPSPSVGIDHIECEFESESIVTLWKGVRAAESEVVEASEVEAFLNGIEEHLAQHFSLKFQAFPLLQLQLPIVHLHREGKIKMLSKEHIYTVLSHLTCLALEKIDWRVPG